MNFSIFQRLTFSLGCAVALNMPIVSTAALFQPAYAADQSTLSEFPGRRVGGGSRGECMSNATLVALSPQNHLIETTEATPTLYFAMPSFDAPLQLEFVLKNRDGDIIADKLFEAESHGGVTGLDLTDQIEPLKVGENYEWYLSILCNANNRAQDIVVHGWMRRVPSETVEIVETSAQVSEQVELYQSQGLWHDAIDLLIQVQGEHTSSFNVDALWSDLLTAEGLQHLVNEEIQPNL